VINPARAPGVLWARLWPSHVAATPAWRVVAASFRRPSP
jgi:hypothetical protein